MSGLRKSVYLGGASGLILAGGLLVWAWLGGIPSVESPPALAPPSVVADRRMSRELLERVAALEAQERHLNETVWAPEMLAQQQGRVLEDLWNSVNASAQRLAVIAQFPVEEVVLGRWSSVETLEHGIRIIGSVGSGRVLRGAEWRAQVEQWVGEGWQLGELELRQVRFELDESGGPRASGYYLAAQLTHSGREERVLIEGDLEVVWGEAAIGRAADTVRRIDASALTLQSRLGEPAFRLVREERAAPPEHAHSVDPLLVYDLDGDGRSEVVLAGKNLVYRWHSDGDYRPEPLCKHPPGVLTTALLADFDGDGNADFLCATLKGLLLYLGSSEGRFERPGSLAWPARADWKYPMVLSAGDVDRDGDLDLFVGQYQVPYEDGVMPTPYYDANDGHPDYLLVNDGTGRFTDVTVAAGLSAKRGRRTYSSSLVDLDNDGDLDLVVISDFAGVDLYRNDGEGRFADVTDRWIDDPRAFGMSHALADFDRDGRLDLVMLGMTSPTVDRLEDLGLWRPDIAEDRSMRARMMFGNRLYVARPGGGFGQTRLSATVARSGWSWGCSAADFDNDGFVDLFVANGLESRASVRDYESEYWLHDRYVGSSERNSAVYLYFRAKFGRTRGRGESYGGYDRNRLFWSRGGRLFVEVGHLLGLGAQEDARNVVADDFDGDGRVDLLVTGFGAWPDPTHRLWFYHNRWPDGGNWIGFRFREGGVGRSPIGARVRLEVGGVAMQRQIVTGDSYRSQHPPVVHFGLGPRDGIDRVEIRWTCGRTLTLVEPTLNCYHDVVPPTDAG